MVQGSGERSFRNEGRRNEETSLHFEAESLRSGKFPAHVDSGSTGKRGANTPQPTKAIAEARISMVVS
jgi:hypothetical protein